MFVCQTAKNDHDRRFLSVFSVCANFFSGEILNFPFVSIALTVGVAGSLKVSFESS